MSVLSCSRKNCSNIMCDTYVENVGYVCYECQDEFKGYLIRDNIVVNTDVDIEYQLNIFMEIDKGEFKKGNEISVDEFFSKSTRR